MIDYKELKQIAIDRNPLADYIRRTGRDLKKQSNELVCTCFHHDDKSPSMSVNEDKNLYHCFSCGASGNVIDLHMFLKGLEFKDAVKELADYREPVKTEPRTITYEYKDAYGKLVFCVDRIEDGKGGKTFRQYHFVDGKKVYSMEGVTRVLYRLDKIADKPEVVICEGEKCAHALVRLGYDATCNVGGSNNWLPAYAECLRDKDIIIMPDNDEAGQKWHGAVLESLKGKAKSIQTLRMPAKYNDVADAYAELGEDTCDLIMDLQKENPPVKRGEDVPIYSYDELMEIHRNLVTAEHRVVLDLGRWLPTIRQVSRPLVPGDMFSLIASTGIGKSAGIQNIAVSVPDLTSLTFQLELGEETMAERWTAIATEESAEMVEKKVKAAFQYSSKNVPNTSNIYTCTLSGISVERIEDIIEQSELKIGNRPHLVMVDYVGLVAGSGNRYEKTSNVLEQLKIVAKRQKVIMGVCVQASRKKDDDDIEISLADGKDSGSIENSCQLVLGMW